MMGVVVVEKVLVVVVVVVVVVDGVVLLLPIHSPPSSQDRKNGQSLPTPQTHWRANRSKSLWQSSSPQPSPATPPGPP